MTPIIIALAVLLLAVAAIVFDYLFFRKHGRLIENISARLESQSRIITSQSDRIDILSRRFDVLTVDTKQKSRRQKAAKADQPIRLVPVEPAGQVIDLTTPQAESVDDVGGTKAEKGDGGTAA